MRKRRVVDLADAALPGGAGIRHQDIDAAEGLRDLVEGRAHRGVVGDVAAQAAIAAPPIALRLVLRRLAVEIEQRDFGAGRGEGFRGRKADGAARPR